MQDLRFAMRHLLKAPSFSITVILTIALGIGANTAIFTLLHNVLMKSLPVVDPKMLVRVGDKDDCCVNGGFLNDDGDFDLFSYPLYKHIQETTPEFEQLAAMQSGQDDFTVRRGSEAAKSLHSEFVSGNYFQTFGVGAFAGRPLTPGDDVTGAAPAAVLSYQAWQSEYASDPNVVGSTFYVQGQPVTIVGIAPSGFFGDRLRSRPPEIWIPLSIEPVINRDNTILNIAEANWVYLIGRVKPGVGIGSLQSRISNNLRAWLSTIPEYTRNGGSTVIPKQHVIITPAGGGIQNLQQATSKQLYLLMAISGLVLLVACANVANLLLARGTTRRADTSIRMALGAARSRLIRQMLTESVLLSCLGGIVGLGVAYAGTRTILALAFPASPNVPIEASPSLPVLGFAFLLSLLTGVIFGTVPAWITSHSDPAEALRGVNRTTRDRASMPQKWLIVLQAALSLILLVGAGMLTKSLRNMQHQDFGIQTANRYVVHFDPSGAGYSTERLPELYQKLEQQFGALPGVHSVGLALYSPLEGNNWGEGIRVEGRPAPGPNEHNGSSWDRVNPQFFEAVGQPVIRGRGFTDADTATSQMVAVVNQAFVKKFFPKEDPMGRHFGIFDQKYAGAFEIVGVVADAKYTDPREKVRPMYFRPLPQQLKVTETNGATAENRSLYINSIVLQFDRPPESVDALVRRTLTNIDPNLTVTDMASMDYQVSMNFNQERMVARLTMLFGLLALVLASVGLYGITSYSVARRTNEIGLRMALGADRERVLGMVLRNAFAKVIIGLGLGIPVAILGARAMSDQLYGVKFFDPPSIGIGVVALLLATSVAGFIPARRAATIQPMEALRTE
ncbi:MAG TPA: ABC transporter permease [Terriglobales bacterium]|nr:ABC transporter permease [Terriglobales bacterium]